MSSLTTTLMDSLVLQRAASMQYFPHDLFHSYIIPDLFSEYIHELLVNSNSLPWNPFCTLPLVSRHFRDSCRTFCSSIFGPMDDEDIGITNILEGVKDLWNRANQPVTRALPVDHSTGDELKCNNSLVQVYICVATAKSYLNLDVLWHLELERKRLDGELDDADVVMDADVYEGQTAHFAPHFIRTFRMRDDNMHRLYLPLTCAIQLCDQVRPARLAYLIADYLADIIPFYATAPVLLKYTQDLEAYVWGDRRLSVHSEFQPHFMEQTLGLVEGTNRLLQDMQNIGKLVRSFKRDPSIPISLLQATKTLDILDKVADTDWGEGMGWINDYARHVKLGLLSPR